MNGQVPPGRYPPQEEYTPLHEACYTPRQVHHHHLRLNSPRRKQIPEYSQSFVFRGAGNPYKDVVNKLAERVWDDIFKTGGEIDKFLERHTETLYFKALFNM